MILLIVIHKNALNKVSSSYEVIIINKYKIIHKTFRVLRGNIESFTKLMSYMMFIGEIQRSACCNIKLAIFFNRITFKVCSARAGRPAAQPERIICEASY